MYFKSIPKAVFWILYSEYYPYPSLLVPFAISTTDWINQKKIFKTDLNSQWDFFVSHVSYFLFSLINWKPKKNGKIKKKLHPKYILLAYFIFENVKCRIQIGFLQYLILVWSVTNYNVNLKKMLRERRLPLRLLLRLPLCLNLQKYFFDFICIHFT